MSVRSNCPYEWGALGLVLLVAVLLNIIARAADVVARQWLGID